MFAEPKVSVVIPAYNCKNFIASAIESIVRQSYKNIEIVVVDDASTDGTFEKVTSLKEIFPQVVLCSNSRTKGPSGARNTGLNIASGEYVAFLDADDVWLPNHLDGIEFLEKHRDVSVVFFNFNIVEFSSGRVFEDWFSARQAPRVLNSQIIDNKYKLIKDDMFRALVLESFMHLQSMLVRSELCKNILFDESINRSEDRDFSVRLLMEAGAVFAYGEIITGVYYVHGDSLTAPSLENELATVCAHIRIFKGYLNKYKINSEQKSVLRKIIMDRYLAAGYVNRKLGKYFISVFMSINSFYYGFSIKQFKELLKVVISLAFFGKKIS